MANNPYVNKVVYGGTTLIDISDTTATASDVLVGKYFYDKAGAKVEGTSAGGSAITVVETQDPAGGTVLTVTAVDLSNDTVAADKLVSGYTAHNSLGTAITGTYTGVVVSDTTATANDVLTGKYFYTSSGVKTSGALVIQHYYTGSSAPSSSLGSDGDIYLKT